MRRRTKQIGAILALVAMLLFAWPIWKLIPVPPASDALQARTKGLVDQNPKLQAAWERSLSDKVLSRAEAKAIVELAGERLAPDE